MEGRVIIEELSKSFGFKETRVIGLLCTVILIQMLPLGGPTVTFAILPIDVLGNSWQTWKAFNNILSRFKIKWDGGRVCNSV